jgi:hypothetical protein
MKILFAVDGRAASTHALKEGLRLLPLSSAEVVVVSVFDPEHPDNVDDPDVLITALSLLEEGGVRATG